jgi:hypothetical protein
VSYVRSVFAGLQSGGGGESAKNSTGSDRRMNFVEPLGLAARWPDIGARNYSVGRTKRSDRQRDVDAVVV